MTASTDGKTRTADGVISTGTSDTSFNANILYANVSVSLICLLIVVFDRLK